MHGLAGARAAIHGRRRPGSDRLFRTDAPAEPDFDAALKWARQAAEAGSAKGEALLGYVLTYGPESMRDLEEAHRWYERSAAAGCPEGNLGYALSLARRTNGRGGGAKSPSNCARAAEAQLPTAIYLLAVLTEQGLGVPRDPLAAAQLYRDAAEKGHRSAQVRWGLKLIEGDRIEQDRVTGESWLRRAALAGDPEAATLVGNLYVQSGPLPPNYAEAASWYRRAAEGGHKAAARALGSLYLTGAGVPQDNEEATRWLRVAAEAGDQASQVDLANLVLEGAGAPDDAVTDRRMVRRGGAAGRSRRGVQSRRLLGQGSRGRSQSGTGGGLVAPRRRWRAGCPIHVWAHAG